MVVPNVESLGGTARLWAEDRIQSMRRSRRDGVVEVDGIGASVSHSDQLDVVAIHNQNEIGRAFIEPADPLSPFTAVENDLPRAEPVIGNVKPRRALCGR